MIALPGRRWEPIPGPIPGSIPGSIPRPIPGPRTVLPAILVWLWVGWILVAGGAAHGHDILDPEAASAIAAEIDRLQEIAQAENRPASARAEAAFALGQAVTRAAVMLTDDRNGHGGDGGSVSLSSEILRDYLDAAGLALTLSDATGRYHAPLRPFRQAVALDPEGAHAAAARHAIIVHQFYRDTETDPFAADPADWPALQEKARDIQDFLDRYPDWGSESAQEELHFIAALRLANAYRAAPEGAARDRLVAAAHAALDTFLERYPDSLRAGAARYLRSRFSP